MKKAKLINEGSMFVGTKVEFNRYVGGYLRNIVQTSISSKYKKKIGKCEDCNSTDTLEAAHRHGHGRLEIMSSVLKEFTDNNGQITVNLFEFSQKFKDAHNPVDETFRILCKDCHKKYDAK